MLLILKTEEGRNVFWRLLEDADLVAQSYRAGRLEEVGLGGEFYKLLERGVILTDGVVAG